MGSHVENQKQDFYKVLQNPDGTIDVIFQKPLRLTLALLLCLLYDGISFEIIKRRGKNYLVALRGIHPKLFENYLKEWGLKHESRRKPH